MAREFFREHQPWQQALEQFCFVGFQYISGVGRDAVPLRHRHLFQICPARSIENLPRPKSPNERRPKIAVADIAPPANVNIIRLHVPALDISLDAIGHRINLRAFNRFTTSPNRTRDQFLRLNSGSLAQWGLGLSLVSDGKAVVMWAGFRAG